MAVVVLSALALHLRCCALEVCCGRVVGVMVEARKAALDQAVAALAVGAWVAQGLLLSAATARLALMLYHSQWLLLRHDQRCGVAQLCRHLQQRLPQAEPWLCRWDW